MSGRRTEASPTPLLLAFAALALCHALLTWPAARALTLFTGGALLAGVAELSVVRAGLLVHHTRPRVAGVPLAVVAAWPAAVYVAARVAEPLAADATVAALLAAVVATLADAVADAHGVRRRWWSYPSHPLSRVRFRGAPWWNYAGWFAVTVAVARLALG